MRDDVDDRLRLHDEEAAQEVVLHARKTDLAGSTWTIERLEVVGSDEERAGTVDKPVIKLTRKDRAARRWHRILSFDAATSAWNGKVVLTFPTRRGKKQRLKPEPSAKSSHPP